MAEDKGIWKSTEDIEYNNVLCYIERTFNVVKLTIIPDQSSVIIDKNKAANGVYYENADVHFDQQTKMLEISNIVTCVEIVVSDGTTELKEKMNKGIFSTHKTSKRKIGIFKREEVEIVKFEIGELVYIREANTIKRMFMTSSNIQIQIF